MRWRQWRDLSTATLKLKVLRTSQSHSSGPSSFLIGIGVTRIYITEQARHDLGIEENSLASGETSACEGGLSQALVRGSSWRLSTCEEWCRQPEEEEAGGQDKSRVSSPDWTQERPHTTGDDLHDHYLGERWLARDWSVLRTRLGLGSRWLL